MVMDAWITQMLMGIVDSSVKLLTNLQDLVPVLIQLGLRHNAYKVSEPSEKSWRLFSLQAGAYHTLQ